MSWQQFTSTHPCTFNRDIQQKEVWLPLTSALFTVSTCQIKWDLMFKIVYVCVS